MNSFELTDFNLVGRAILLQSAGLIKIWKSEDERLTLITDDTYGLIPQGPAVEMKIANVDQILGFVLDIGIRKEMRLTFGSGMYFGQKLIEHPQSYREVQQSDFDADLMTLIVTTIDQKFHSTNPLHRKKALQLNHLFYAYNNARLLFPHFYDDSYLALVRILDSLVDAGGALSFGLSAAKLSNVLNVEAYQAISEVGGLMPRLELAEVIFSRTLDQLRTSRPSSTLIGEMESLDQQGRFTFVCFYSAYLYRNKFVHQGFPFPNGSDLSKGFLSSSYGESYMKVYRQGGLQEGDHIDIHEVLDRESVELFKEYYQFIPSWYWCSRLTRLALVEHLEQLSRTTENV